MSFGHERGLSEASLHLFSAKMQAKYTDLLLLVRKKSLMLLQLWLTPCNAEQA